MLTSSLPWASLSGREFPNELLRFIAPVELESDSVRGCLQVTRQPVRLTQPLLQLHSRAYDSTQMPYPMCQL